MYLFMYQPSVLDYRDYVILQSILDDGNYEISSEDCASLQVCISHFCRS